ncbi:MAG TPA: hypothetical protein VFT95_06000 [Micromonosporaceae bacterium]|nr:hypothetical protein [Micromonosporaceae bacterium]
MDIRDRQSSRIKRNNCGSKKCYKVDIPWVLDPKLSVAAYATERDAYANINGSQGRGIYEDGC